jgi:alcohol dehydrogenase
LTDPTAPRTLEPATPLEDLRSGESWDAEVGGVRLRFGRGRLSELGPLAAETGARKVLLVTDPRLRRVGHAAAAIESLEREGLLYALFDGVEENPDSLLVEAAAGFAAGQKIDLIVALGGGSSMDCAKGINFLLTNGGTMENYRGYGKAEKPMLPSIGVPTTSGSGSDGQSYALIRDTEGRKMACGAPGARFRAVILDPDLTATVPKAVAAAAGLDSFSHAVESFVSRAANPVSRMLSREAWRLLDAGFEDSLARPAEDPAARRMLIGAHLAGAAIEASMLGAAHACANPLTTRYGIIHGVAIALMLPHVIRFNGAAEDDLYAGLAPTADALATRIEHLREISGLPTRLRDDGVEVSDLDVLAREAAREWTAGFNPRPIEPADCRRLYDAAF